MTKTRTIAAASSLILLLGAVAWGFTSRTTHEIVIAPVQQGAQR
jgi:hypothetical protein